MLSPCLCWRDNEIKGMPHLHWDKGKGTTLKASDASGLLRGKRTYDQTNPGPPLCPKVRGRLLYLPNYRNKGETERTVVICIHSPAQQEENSTSTLG